jgi:lipid-binding SYLF domain-containing protein
MLHPRRIMKTTALHEEALATVERLRAIHPDLKDLFEKSYAYAVFPSVGRASVALSVTFGRGIVFEQKRPIGVASIAELTLGVQVGGQTFSELMFFPSKETLEKLTKSGGEFAFAANASAVIVKAAASGTTNFRGVIAKAYSLGGMLLELSLGPQRINFTREEIPEGRARQPAEQEVARESEATEEPQREHEARPRLVSAQEAIGQAGADVGASVTNVRDQAQQGVATATDEARQLDPEPQKQPRRARRFVKRLGGVLPRSLKHRLAPAIGGLALGGRKLGKALAPVRRQVDKIVSPVRKEQAVSKSVHPAAQAALVDLLDRNESLRERLDKAAGYAIFPSVGKAAAVLGATYGVGEVYEKGRLIGYAALIQLTLGVQLGGDTFSELVILDKPETLKRFKEGKVAFAANAAAVIVKAGAAAARAPTPGSDIELVSEGGMLLETAIGGQKIVFRPAALTRGKKLEVASA